MRGSCRTFRDLCLQIANENIMKTACFVILDANSFFVWPHGAMRAVHCLSRFVTAVILGFFFFMLFIIHHQVKRYPLSIAF